MGATQCDPRYVDYVYRLPNPFRVTLNIEYEEACVGCLVQELRIRQLTLKYEGFRV